MRPVCNFFSSDAVGFCHFHKIRALNIDERISSVVEKFLPLAHHTKELIVQYDYFHINPCLHDGTQFLNGHLESSIASNGNYRSFRCSVFCTDGSRQCKSHGTES